MEAKEKAKQLFNKMYFAEDQDGFHSMNKYRAKQCALIAVDELIKATVPLTSTYYWQEVKQEIENYD
jgi:hypothetical protein